MRKLYCSNYDKNSTKKNYDVKTSTTFLLLQLLADKKKWILS